MQAQATEIQYTYARRRPERTPCYQIVLAVPNTFIENREGEGKPLPAYVIKCVFRRSRSPVSAQAGHLFRRKPVSDADPVGA
jgi:hypothetical protein